MALTTQDRRDIVALCCAVARADGIVSTLEFERLVGLLARIAQGLVGLDELQEWLSKGPPVCSARLAEEHLRLFLHEAIGVASADGHVDESEIETIKSLVSRCFTEGPKYT